MLVAVGTDNLLGNILNVCVNIITVRRNHYGKLVAADLRLEIERSESADNILFGNGNAKNLLHLRDAYRKRSRLGRIARGTLDVKL